MAVGSHPPSSPFEAVAGSALRQKVLAVELEAERMELQALEAIAPPPGDTPAEMASAGNLACYARHAGIPAPAAPFATLLDAFAGLLA